jgi:uncharacterized protein related to proFAR isomerase
MKIIPAMSIKEGRVAVASGRNYTYLTNANGLFRSPVNVLKEAELPGEEIFILDIDGLEGRMPNLKTVGRISAHREVWLEAGTSDADSMMDLFVAGVSKVAMGTLSLASLDELAAALEISEDVIFSVAYDGGVVSGIPGIGGAGIDALLSETKELNPGPAIFFDLGGLRDSTPPDADVVAKLAGRFGQVFVCGHFGEGDIERMRQAGAAGAIVDFRKLERKDE